MNGLVRAGYDRIAGQYQAQRNQFENRPHLEQFVRHLPSGGRVLDIGCGTGVPVARFLMDLGFVLAGIDISPRMVELARRNVRGAAFEVRDMLTLNPGEYEVDGIVSLYSVFHVEREQHADLLRTFRSFLRASGTLLISMGADEWEGIEADFHGAEMSWSHFGREQNRRMLEEAGLEVEVDEIDTSAGERHQILIPRT